MKYVFPEISSVPDINFHIINTLKSQRPVFSVSTQPRWLQLCSLLCSTRGKTELDGTYGGRTLKILVTKTFYQQIHSQFIAMRMGMMVNCRGVNESLKIHA